MIAPSVQDKGSKKKPMLEPGVIRERQPKTPLPSSRPSPRRWRAWLTTAVAVLAVAVGGRVIPVYFGSNVHAVIPGLVYRSSQPTFEQLRNLVNKHGIQTIINLRGCGNGMDWYLDECRTVQDLGLAMEDVGFSANRTPSVTELRRLIEVLDRAQYPVLIHCRRGADRTGMASVIALILLGDTPLGEARSHLGPRYGHVPLSQTAILDRFFDQYEGWLVEGGQAHSRELFRTWILNEYGKSYAHAWEEVTPLQSCIGRGEPSSFRVRLRNTGCQVWNIRAGKGAGMHLGYQVFAADCAEPLEGRAGLLDREVRPGEVWEVTLVLPPFRQAGRYRLLLDMVEEKHCWFFQAGAEPHEQELLIRE